MEGGERGELWKDTESLERVSETATNGDRQAERRRERGRGRGGEVQSTQPCSSSVWPKSISVPRSFSPQPCSHAAPGAVREEGGWTYGGGGMDGGEGGWVREGGGQDTERERGREDEGSLLCH